MCDSKAIQNQQKQLIMRCISHFSAVIFWTFKKAENRNILNVCAHIPTESSKTNYFGSLRLMYSNICDIKITNYRVNQLNPILLYLTKYLHLFQIQKKYSKQMVLKGIAQSSGLQEQFETNKDQHLNQYRPRKDGDRPHLLVYQIYLSISSKGKQMEIKASHVNMRYGLNK